MILATTVYRRSGDAANLSKLPGEEDKQMVMNKRILSMLGKQLRN